MSSSETATKNEKKGGKVSAGILLYRKFEGALAVLLVHPGGPFFRKKDAGAWSIPKGEPGSNEELIDTAFRELREELDIALGRDEKPMELGNVKQAGGKVVHCWALPCPPDVPNGPYTPKSSSFETEWPPRSGRLASFPEVDLACLYFVKDALKKINPAQRPFLQRLSTEIVKGR